MRDDGSKTVAGTKTTESTYSTRPAKPSRFAAVGKSLIGGGLMTLALIILFSFGAGFGGGFLGAQLYNNNNDHNSQAAQERFISDEGELIADIAKRVGQSVVSVDVKSRVNAQDVFGFNFPSTQESAGTGFIVSADGVVVTNRHVVPVGSSNVSVTMSDGTKYKDVKVIGRTNNSSPLDVAFLKINSLGGKKLKALTLGDSEKVQVGDRVIAIGNALGQFQNTVTSGIISGYGRDVTAGTDVNGSSESLSNLFQTDAAINQGNSGGPLVNISGRVIGINTAVASGQNIGFAIPINDIKGLINGVLTKGKLEQPYLGVRYVQLTPEYSNIYNIETDKGAYIVPSQDSSDSIMPGSPAAKAGLKEKDIITKVNDTDIGTKSSLTSVLSRFKVGDHVNLTVLRDGKTMTVQVKLEAAPSN